MIVQTLSNLTLMTVFNLLLVNLQSVRIKLIIKLTECI